jgi:hypothetical protein
MEKILAVVFEAYGRQVEETMYTLSEGPERRSYSQDLTASVPDEAAPMSDGVGGDAATTGTSMR